MTDDTKSTPGPWAWTFGDEAGERPEALVALDADADVLTIRAADDGTPWLEMGLADRLLIQAAPCLLAACEAALDRLDELQSIRASTDDLADVLRDAVGKAKGGVK